MTEPNHAYPLPNADARRAGVMLLACGAAAAVIGLLLVVAGLRLPDLAAEPAVRDMLAELRKEWPFDPAILFVAQGAVFGGYGAAAATVGFLLRRGGRATRTVGLIFAGGVALLAAAVGGLAVVQGAAGGAVLPLAACVAHAAAARWLFRALRHSSDPSMRFEPWTPMREYYLPPVPPAPRP